MEFCTKINKQTSPFHTNFIVELQRTAIWIHRSVRVLEKAKKQTVPAVRSSTWKEFASFQIIIVHSQLVHERALILTQVEWKENGRAGKRSDNKVVR